jgi:hypothetical protein
VSFALVPGPLEGYSSVDDPFGIERANSVLGALLSVGALVIVVTLLAGIASLVVRYRRSQGVERQQMKWFIFAAAIPPLALLGNDLFLQLAWLIGGVVGVACIPAVLDELGLVSALRETAAKFSQNGLRVLVRAPDELPPLPAAVEVAAYRIAQEVLTNVLRHAGARECTVRFRLDEEAALLCLEVEDDGRGIGWDGGPGVGLSSMRERAEELGGAFEPVMTGGTCVRAELPVPEASRGGEDPKAETSKIRVLIADDHPLFRDGMHGLLDSVEETEW